MRITTKDTLMAKPVRATLSPTHEVRQSLAAYDTSAPKRPTNVSVNEDLLAKARDLGVNLSQTLEDGLKARVAEERRRSDPAYGGECVQRELPPFPVPLPLCQQGL